MFAVEKIIILNSSGYNWKSERKKNSAETQIEHM